MPSSAAASRVTRLAPRPSRGPPSGSRTGRESAGPSTAPPSRHERHDFGNDVGRIDDPRAAPSSSTRSIERVAVRRLGFDDCLRVRVKITSPPIVSASRSANSVSTSIRTVARAGRRPTRSGPCRRRRRCRSQAAPRSDHRSAAEIGDPVDSEAPARPGLGLVSHDVPVPAPRADGPGLEHPSLPAVGERDRVARTLRLQEREGVGGHGEEDLGRGRRRRPNPGLQVGVGLALEGDDDGAGGGDRARRSLGVKNGGRSS